MSVPFQVYDLQILSLQTGSLVTRGEMDREEKHTKTSLMYQSAPQMAALFNAGTGINSVRVSHGLELSSAHCISKESSICTGIKWDWDPGTPIRDAEAQSGGLTCCAMPTPHFTFSTVPFEAQFLSLVRTHFITFFFSCLCLWCPLKNCLIFHKDLCLFLLLRNLHFNS